MIDLKTFVVEKELLGIFTDEAVRNYNVPVYTREGDIIRRLSTQFPGIPKARERQQDLIMVITVDYKGEYAFKC